MVDIPDSKPGFCGFDSHPLYQGARMNTEAKANEIINKLAGFPVGKFKDLVHDGLKEAYQQGLKNGEKLAAEKAKKEEDKPS